MSKNINKENIYEVLKEFEKGNQLSALKKMQRYIKHNEQDFITRYNYAVMLDRNGQKEEAKLNYKKVLIKDSKNWRALSNLYLIYFDENKFEKSLVLVNRLLDTLPNNQPALRDKAHIEFYLNKLNEAKKNIELSIKLNPKDYIALNILGMIMDKMGLFEQAKEIYLNTIKINKNYYPTYSNLGKTYMELMDPDEAIKILKEGIRINPNFENAYNNLGNAYNKIGKYNEAIKIYRTILEKNPNHKEVNSNIALSYFNNKNFNEAKKYFLLTKKINPNEMNFRKNFAHFLLYKQKYNEAWSYWDDRLKKDKYYFNREWKNNIRDLIYTGNNLSKKDNILVIKEQGIGDEILYSTIYTDLINEFPNCKIETEKRLVNLFKKSYNAEKNIIPFLSLSNNNINLKKFNKIIFAGSLGKFFRKDVKNFPLRNSLCASKPDLNLISSIFKKYDGKKIGISWKSKREFYGEGKSIKLEDFEELFKMPNCNFINLQYGDINEDLDDIKNNNNIKLVTLNKIDLMNDFEKISALLSTLDLFITVSNSTAHLAGALNVPTLLIKPKSYAIFHYWNQPSNKTPWYPSITLIEQKDDLEKTNLEIIKTASRILKL